MLGAANVPARGPVVFAANHVGVIDGPMLAIYAPRPVHALTKVEMFSGRLGTLLRWSGQVPLDRFRTDVAAARSCLRVLRDDGAIGIFPEGHRGRVTCNASTGGRRTSRWSRVRPWCPCRSSAPGSRVGAAARSRDAARRLHVVFGHPSGSTRWPSRGHEGTSGGHVALLWQHMMRELDAAWPAPAVSSRAPCPQENSNPTPPPGSPI